MPPRAQVGGNRGSDPGPSLQQWASYLKRHWVATPRPKDPRALGSDRMHRKSCPRCMRCKVSTDRVLRQSDARRHTERFWEPFALYMPPYDAAARHPWCRNVRAATDDFYDFAERRRESQLNLCLSRSRRRRDRTRAAPLQNGAVFPSHWTHSTISISVKGVGNPSSSAELPTK